MAVQLGRFWTAHEIRALLRILITNNYGPVLFVVGTRRNEHAFQRASEELQRQAYNRSSRQCRSKFKTLQQLFNRAILDFGPNPPEEHKSPYFDELKELWDQANRPHPGHAFPAEIPPGMDIMEMPVTQRELKQLIALIQELTQRVAALEEQVAALLAPRNQLVDAGVEPKSA